METEFIETDYPDERAVVAPPLTKRIEALEFTDPHIPGEIKLDKAGKLLKNYIQYEGPVGSLIDEFNNWVTNKLIQQIQSQTLQLEEGEVTFDNLVLFRPRVATGTNTWDELSPTMARNSGYSYLSEIYIDLVLNKDQENEETLRNAFLGKLPVMLGSILDNLHGKSEQEKVNLGESIYDPYGYFIIKGTEKVILIQEQLRSNRFFIFNSSSKGNVVCKVTNNTLMGATNISMLQGKKSGALKMHLGFMGRRKPNSKIGNTMSVFQIYRMLGIDDPTEILKHIAQFTKPQYVKRMFVALQPTFVKLSKVGDDIEYISKKKGMGDQAYVVKKNSIMNDLINQLFPQVPADDIETKLDMLSIMTVRLLEYIIGVRELDDRDNWGNKQLISAGKSLERLFSSIWKELINRTQDQITSKKLHGLQSVKIEINSGFITDNFVESFTANNWGVQTSYLPKENITDILKRDSVLAVYSHLTKINTPTSRKAKSPKIRLVQMSQLGYISAGETPEGMQIGLVKNSAITNYISIERPESVVLEHISQFINVKKTEQTPNPFMLNGVFRGWVDGLGLRDYCVGLRRKLILFKDTLIIFDREGYLLINTDASRPTRPLLIVDTDGRLVIQKKNLYNVDFETLLREGCVEYIDAQEQEYIMLAQTMDEVDQRRRELSMATKHSQDASEKLEMLKSQLENFTGTPTELAALKETINDTEITKSQAEATLAELLKLPRYTHSELDPTAIESIAISIIPLPETNPGPRLTYQAGMGKQALGIYHSNHIGRFETTAKVLAYPSRPLFETQMNEVLGLNELPAGEMVILAITTYGGYSQEDAIIMSQGAIDRGLFRYVVYKTYKSVQKRTRDFTEEFARPEIRSNEPQDRYHAIDENGFPKLGSHVKEGQCVIGKIRKFVETGKVENASVFMEIKQEGVIDRVLISTNPEGNRVIKVKIRTVRKPVIGDKFSSRYSQKGTIGMILPDEDMPFTAEGVRPDCIINSHCFTKDTPICTYKGYSKRISDFSEEGGEKVWCFDKTNKYLTVSKSMGMEPKGKKKIMKVFLQDGRIIKCTPDHRFLTLQDGEYKWEEAQNTFGKRVVCGLEMPVDEPELDIGSDWELKTVEYTFNLKTPENREKSLAFARMLGYVLTDGCIYYKNDIKYKYASTVNLGHKIDAQAFQDDVFLITGKKPKFSLVKGTWNLRLPAPLSGSMGNLEGVQYGRRSSQEITWPEFILDEDCPKSVLREFIAGLCGGDGCAPHIIERPRDKAFYLIPGGFCTTCKEGYQDNLKIRMEQLCKLMEKLGVKTTRIDGPKKVRISENSYKPLDGIQRYDIRINLENNTIFANKIGFRYCIQKSCRLSAALTYWRYKERIIEQHSFVVKRTNEIYQSGKARQHTNKKSIKVSLEMAREELMKEDFVIHKHYSLSNVTDIHNRRNNKGWSAKTLTQFSYKKIQDVKQWFEEIGCLDWWTRETNKPEYIVKRGSMEVPTFNLKVIGLKYTEPEEVYDIGVYNHHNFLAHGSVVHNCIPSRMTVGKLIEIVTSKVAALQGERVNGTGFRKFDVQEFMRALKEYGYSNSGKERLYSGFTGKPLQAMIFTGPCYYQALRHHVADKIQMRARGGIRHLTRQPVGGRKRGGGQRIGEMERDAIISHGASAFLNERLCGVSDPYETVYCATCGTIAIANHMENKYVCRKCEDKVEFGTCTIPYVFKLMSQLLSAAHYDIKFTMKTDSTNP